MMYSEFEEIAGYEVSFDTYVNIIEPMYMALPDSVSKQEFVKMLNKKAFALPTKSDYVKEMRKIACHLSDICGHSCDWEAERDLFDKIEKYAKKYCGYSRGNESSWIRYEKIYEYGDRGCSFVKSFTVMYGYTEIETVILVK